MKQLRAPALVLDAFCHLADDNSKEGNETLGVLFGKQDEVIDLN
jgi:hypothetical protein